LKNTTVLDIFALLVLLVLIAAAVAVWIILGMLPGRIAHARDHPQAEAITVFGWWGVLTTGILCPLAFVWAYTESMKATHVIRRVMIRMDAWTNYVIP
jgi:uncharacterized BrkB/YihY/UPF0761 family membrane protein